MFRLSTFVPEGVFGLFALAPTIRWKYWFPLAWLSARFIWSGVYIVFRPCDRSPPPPSPSFQRCTQKSQELRASGMFCNHAGHRSERGTREWKGEKGSWRVGFPKVSQIRLRSEKINDLYDPALEIGIILVFFFGSGGHQAGQNFTAWRHSWSLISSFRLIKCRRVFEGKHI